MKVVPWLSLLRKTAGFAIYQNLTVPQVIKKVFARHKIARYELDLTEKYPAADSCVQYRETDRNFVDRMLEHVGVFAYFVHRENEHVLVLSDNMTRRKPFAGYAGFSHDGTTPGLHPISEWSATHNLRTGRYTLKDFNFEEPASTRLLVTKTLRRGHALDDLAIYDYPGGYRTPQDAAFFTRLRLEELQAQHHVISGTFSGSLPGVMPGHVVALKDHPISSHDGRYMVTSTSYNYAADGSASLRFAAVPLTTRYRPSRDTAWPTIQGAQTAIVVGPRGKRVSDALGRIKVRFHWTRPNLPDQGSSAWVRVAFPMPYQKDATGFLIPKAGQEVLVHFLEGEPDRPVVTGILYNKDARDPQWPGSAVQLETR
jgi:type VI secretion system secreted protein VgrG